MKKGKLITLFILVILVVCIVTYIMLPEENKLMVDVLVEVTSSIVEVPICYSRIANELGIESGNVRTYVIESLEFGMKPSEVETTLSQIAPVSILETSTIDSTQNTHIAMRVHLCNNHFGHVILNTYYSQDEGLIRVEDAWGD